MDYAILALIIGLCLGASLGYRSGFYRGRNHSAPVDAAPRGHLSRRGTPADCADELPDDVDSAGLAARLQAARDGGA